MFHSSNLNISNTLHILDIKYIIIKHNNKILYKKQNKNQKIILIIINQLIHTNKIKKNNLNNIIYNQYLLYKNKIKSLSIGWKIPIKKIKKKLHIYIQKIYYYIHNNIYIYIYMITIIIK